MVYNHFFLLISIVLCSPTIAMQEPIKKQQDLSSKQKELVKNAFRSIYALEYHLLGISHQEKFKACLTAISEMINADVSINVRSTSGTTLLHHAAGKGEVSLVHILVEVYGADVSARTPDCMTPAECAFRNRLSSFTTWYDNQTKEEFNGMLHVYTFLKNQEGTLHKKNGGFKIKTQKSVN